MTKLLFSVFFSLMIFRASSQRIYFVYLQTESQQPFFVKMEEKIHSSTASGYLILSRLKDSTYRFTVGFPGNTTGEQKFACTINKKDHGYLLKNFPEKGWGLLDLETLAVQMAVNDGKKETSFGKVPVNAFTDLLARAADDSTLKQQNIIIEEKVPEATNTAVVKKPIDSNAHTSTNASSAMIDTKAGLADSARTTVQTPASTLIKKKEDSRETGMQNNNRKKSIPEKIVLQPTPSSTSIKAAPGKEDSTWDRAEKKTVLQSKPPVSGKSSGTEIVSQVTTDVAVAPISPLETATPVQTPEAVYARSKVVRKSESSTTAGLGLTYLDTYADGKQDTIRILIVPESRIQFADLVTKDTIVKKQDTGPVVSAAGSQRNVSPESNGPVLKSKNTCRELASDADFYRLRKKMAGGKSDGDMLEEAKKSFRFKCYTTGQIKNLGTLFLGDGGKYNFFDAAATHISDAENFPSLQAEFRDEYFINRFKSILP